MSSSRLLIAVLRSLPGPVFFPVRILAIAYTDLFRGVPTILVIFMLGFGAPALQLTWVPSSPLFWGVVALVLVYSAYVAEVYRAGHRLGPPQPAGGGAFARAQSRSQSLRYVVLPQAVRRVVPPLLNDFIGLQKDTALVALIGLVEAFRQAQIDERRRSTSRLICGGAAVHRCSPSRWRASPIGSSRGPRRHWRQQ